VSGLRTIDMLLGIMSEMPHYKWNVMLPYRLHRLAVTQDGNRSVEDRVDDDHPADPSMHPCYRRPSNA
jgi:hypothetical protein